MPEDLIQYEVLVVDALRGVVRDVLQRVSKRGIPGDHHFFITFDTRAPGVGLSKRLRDQYPQDMTIVLQHQFWDLAVTEDRFEVRLSFNNIPERLVVPFSAVRIFQDPTVHFALALRPPEEAESDKGAISADMALLPGPKPDFAGIPPAGRVSGGNREETPASPGPGNEAGPGDERPTAEVVSLDRFRKK